MKAEDSDLATVIAYSPPVYERAVSVELRLAPTVEAFPGALPCPTSYYLVPCVEWPLDGESGHDMQHLPVWLDVYCNAAFSLDPYSNGIFNDYHPPCIGERISRDSVNEWHATWGDSVEPDSNESESESEQTLQSIDDDKWCVVCGCDTNSDVALWCGECEIVLCDTCGLECSRDFAVGEPPCEHQLEMCAIAELHSSTGLEWYCDRCGDTVHQATAAWCKECTILLCAECSSPSSRDFSSTELLCRHQLHRWPQAKRYEEGGHTTRAANDTDLHLSSQARNGAVVVV